MKGVSKDNKELLTSQDKESLHRVLQIIVFTIPVTLHSVAK